MVWEKSIQVRAISNAKAIYLPKDWAIRKGDMLLTRCTIDGKNYVNTSKAQFNCSAYIYIPKFWPIYPGDIVDFKITFANVPVRPAGYDEQYATEVVPEDIPQGE